MSASDTAEGQLLWTPSPERIKEAQLTRFRGWLGKTRGLVFPDYGTLWRWSVEDLEVFWRAVWEYFDVLSDEPFDRAVTGEGMFRARWFERSRTNYAEHLLRHEAIAAPDEIAICHFSEARPRGEITWRELGARVRVLATLGAGSSPNGSSSTC